jgi:hypothetical protein
LVFCSYLFYNKLQFKRYLGFGMMGESDALVLDVERLLAELAAG